MDPEVIQLESNNLSATIQNTFLKLCHLGGRALSGKWNIYSTAHWIISAQPWNEKQACFPMAVSFILLLCGGGKPEEKDLRGKQSVFWVTDLLLFSILNIYPAFQLRVIQTAKTFFSNYTTTKSICSPCKITVTRVWHKCLTPVSLSLRFNR